LTTSLSTSNEQCYGVAVQSDGKIVGAGYTTNDWNEFAVVRYNSNGSLDNSFGSGGITSTNIGGGDNDANEVMIQSDGKIVVAGNSLNVTNWDFGLVRYNSDGSVDSTFGTNGKVLTDFSGGNDFCLSLAIQFDSRIVCAGFGQGTGRDFVAARYDAGAVGLNEPAVENTISLYPNPFSAELVLIKTPGRGVLILFNALGNEVLRQTTLSPETRINTEELLPGIYLLKYQSADETQSLRVVKF
jgi:uncharacterized delta-60 repeat protein